MGEKMIFDVLTFLFFGFMAIVIIVLMVGVNILIRKINQTRKRSLDEFIERNRNKNSKANEFRENRAKFRFPPSWPN